MRLRRMPVGFAVFLPLLILQGATPVDAGKASVHEADEAFFQHDIARAAKLYGKVASDKAVEPDDRAYAARRAAMLTWRFYESPGEARAILAEASASGAKVADLLAELADLEIDGKHYEAARKAAKRSLAAAKTESERKSARLRWSKAVIEDPSVDRSLLDEALANLRKPVGGESGVLPSSRLYLRAALLAGDGPGAFEAWRSYYRVPPGGKPYALLEGAYGDLQKILPGWHGEADTGTTVRLIRALGGSRFFAEAAIVARLPGVAAEARAQVAPLLAYADYIQDVAEVTDAYYRKTAVGKTTAMELDRPLVDLTLRRWHELALPGDPPAPDAKGLSPKRVQEIGKEIHPAVTKTFDERYNTYINFGNTAGYYDLHMGHAVSDDRHTVKQYGHTAGVRFVVLDAIVSNGFESWAWAFHSEHGGWAKPEAIYQVRPASAGVAIRAWEQLTDPDERREWDEKIARDTAGDDTRAKADSYAYLPGLEGRLRRDASSRLRDRLAAKGLTGGALRIAFLREFDDALQDSAIFLHEGRHVIDKRMGIEGSEELEYRAKLSEIAFARQPKASLSGGILAPNIGDKTPHGQANLRLVSGLVEWMKAHRDAIEGLDAGRPLLPQLDLLTDEQLRQAARSLDPLAKDEARSDDKSAAASRQGDS